MITPLPRRRHRQCGRAPDLRLKLRSILALITAASLILAALSIWPHQNATADAPIRRLRVALPEGPSARTIGFYLAQQNGAFGKRGLEVEFITPGDRSPVELLNDGKVDLAVEIMPVALRLREKGAAVQHVAQFFQHAGLALYCRPPVKRASDLRGTTIGVWFGGQESPFYAWMGRLNIGTFGEEDGVTVLRQSRGPSALTAGRSDCLTSTTYLLPIQARQAKVAAKDFTVFRYEDQGVATLEDGLYARARDLSDKDRLELFAGFLAGALQGWRQLHDDRAGALRLLRQLTAGTTATTRSSTGSATDTRPDETRPDETRPDDATLNASLAAVDALIDGATRLPGRLNPAAYDRTVNILLTGAPDPVLTRAPAGALSEAVWRRLQRAR